MKYILIALLALTGCTEINEDKYRHTCSRDFKILDVRYYKMSGLVTITKIEAAKYSKNFCTSQLSFDFACKRDDLIYESFAEDNFEEVMQANGFGRCDDFKINVRISDLEAEIEKD